jgi:hypothetical protein
MEILAGPFEPVQLLDLIKDGRLPTPSRRHRPRHYAAFVSKQGVIVFVVRSDQQMTMNELRQVADRECRNTVFFILNSEQFLSLIELKERISACATAYALPPPSGGLEECVVDGKRVLVLGSRRRPD